MNRLLHAACLVLACAGSGAAADLEVPIVERGGDGQLANCASSTVAGLDPAGDGFLAVRSGPGSDYRKLDELYNGDVVIEFERRGAWVGVVYRTRNVSCASTVDRLVPYPRKGWIHGRWLQPLAG